MIFTAIDKPLEQLQEIINQLSEQEKSLDMVKDSLDEAVRTLNDILNGIPAEVKTQPTKDRI